MKCEKCGENFPSRFYFRTDFIYNGTAVNTESR
jgi:hypothetical protein